MEGGDDRVIESLGMVIEEAQGFSGIDAGIADGLEKVFAGGVMRAAESGEDAIVIEELEGAEVDFLVTAHGVVERFFVSRE